MTRKSCHFLSFPTRRTSEDLPPPTPTELAKPLVFFPCVGGVRTSPVLLVATLYLWYSVLTTPFFVLKKRLHSQGLKGLLPFPLTHNRGTFSPAKIIGRRAEEASSSPLRPMIFSPDQRDRFSLWKPFSTLRFLNAKRSKITRFNGVADGELLYYENCKTAD